MWRIGLFRRLRSVSYARRGVRLSGPVIEYTGIIVLILGDSASGIYVGFYREPVLQKTYWTMACSRLYTLTPKSLCCPSGSDRPSTSYKIGNPRRSLTVHIVVHPLPPESSIPPCSGSPSLYPNGSFGIRPQPSTR